jgi:outer membrane immunogenic protein
MAADLPVKAPVTPAAVFTWTGFYVGLNAGGAWGRSDARTSVSCAPVPGISPLFCSPTVGQANAIAVAAAGTGSRSDNAFTGGGQIGYNWQNSSLVYGLEADFGAFRLRTSRLASAHYPVNFGAAVTTKTFTVTSSFDTDWLFTARGRVGWAFTNLLAYATGGLAITNPSATYVFTDTPGVPAAGTWSNSETKVGWTVGGGLEWAMNRNWTAKVEYLYLNFGSVNATGTVFSPSPPGYASATSTAVDLTAHIARAGINYKF